MHTPRFPRPDRLALAVALALAGSAVQAANFNVTVGTDDGTGNTPGTLSKAILDANTAVGADTITLTTDVTIAGVMTRLINSDLTLQSDATTRTISGGNLYRPLFVKSGTVTITNLNLNNGYARGGDGNSGGGGGGFGGALFVYGGAVTVQNVGFTNDGSTGGAGYTGGGYLGGGGMSGNSANGGGGGGGLFGAGQGDTGGYGGSGAYGGYGGTGGVTGGNGGFGGGGGGVAGANGGNGGFGGGGGYGGDGGYYLPKGYGGRGGFGGGGGYGYYRNGGQGGFGGGGSKYMYGGYGGGYGEGINRGGGGAGFGGAIFVKKGTLTLKNVSFTGSSATKGFGGSAKRDGQGRGGAIFICTNDLRDSGTDQAPSQCAGSIDEANSFGVTFTGSTATTGQPDLFWTQASGGAHSTAGITDAGGGGPAGPAVSFTLSANPVTGANPRSIATGDLNGDGKLDLAIANESSDSVSVLLGNGDGTFAAMPDVPISASPGFIPYSVALGDLDGDGKLDLVTANYGANTASILLGNGDGTFVARPDVVTGLGPTAVALGDLNGDAKLDLVISNLDDSSVSVLLGQGDGSFLAQPAVAIGGGGYSLALGDLDGDGKLDLAAVNFNANTTSILLGNGDGTFLTMPDLAGDGMPVSVAIGDLNGDGKRDLVTANFIANTVGILLGNGDGTFRAMPDVATGAMPAAVAVGDLNGDALPDLITANYSAGTASILLGSGDGTFQAGPAVVTGTHSDVVALGDFDADGKSDWAVANWVPTGGAAVFLNTTPLALSFTGDTLRITPPPVSTFGPTRYYTIHYSTQARIDARLPWIIWAKYWPADRLALDLGLTQTITGCRSQGAPSAWCYRPPQVGQHGSGQTFVYRVFASDGVRWSPASPNLTVTRP